MTRREFVAAYRQARVLHRATVNAGRQSDKAAAETAESAWLTFAQPHPQPGVRLVGRHGDFFHPAAYARMTRDDRPWWAVSSVLVGRCYGFEHVRWLMDILRTRAARQVRQ